jgi:hypothetical protein
MALKGDYAPMPEGYKGNNHAPFAPQGKFMKESYPRKWVLEPRRPQADGFCIFAGARFLAAVKCRIRFSAGWFWAAQSLVWT